MKTVIYMITPAFMLGCGSADKKSKMLLEANRLHPEPVIEVPGFEHAYHHTEGHERKPAPQMTDESILEYQRNAKQAIESIHIQLHYSN